MGNSSSANPPTKLPHAPAALITVFVFIIPLSVLTPVILWFSIIKSTAGVLINISAP